MGYFDFPHTRTYDTDLGWIIKHISEYDDVIQALNDWIAENTPKINEILAFFELLQSGVIPEGLKNSLYQWANDNLMDIVAKTLKGVVFGLTDDGYFVATYYDSWSDITFNTTEMDIWTPLQTQYGHLVLSI